MDYRDVFRDFIYRTSENLRVIEDLARRPDPQVGQVYEVTQLINSLLGLIVFPHEAFPDSIPDKRLDDLAKEGWPKPRIVIHNRDVRCETLCELYHRLRNGVAHWNLEPISEEGEIVGLRLYDRQNRRSPRRIEVELELNELRKLTRRFIELALAGSTYR